MNSSSLAYRSDIDGLRAFAVLAVVAYHAFPFLVGGGFIGVDVFFVISGYLICGIILSELQQGTFSLWSFYSRRIRRIFPALIVVLVVALTFGWFTLFPDEYRALGKHTFGGSAFISNFLLWYESGYFEDEAKANPLLHLWSLGIEEQFYIIFPLLLWCCAKKHVRIVAVLATLCILSFSHNIYSMSSLAANFYSPSTRAWELLAGAILCASMRHTSTNEIFLKLDALIGKAICGKVKNNDGSSLSLVLALLGVILLCIALVLIRGHIPYPGWQALLPVFGTILLISAKPLNPISKYLLTNRIAVFIGLVSYPFYLWHWTLISYAFIINGELGPGTRLLRTGLVVVSFALAVLTYFLLEKPIRFGTKARTEKTYAFIICMIIIGVAGLSLWTMDGLPGRGDFEKHNMFMEQLRKDEWKKWVDKEGIAYIGIEKDKLDFCKYTNYGFDETVAIFGDSHALSAYFGIAKLGKELGYNTVLLGWPRTNINESVIQNDIKQRNIIFDILKEKKDIQKVFISLYGAGHISMLKTHTNEAQAVDLFKKHLQSYVDTLRAYGKDVFILNDNPQLPDSPRKYVSRPLFFAPIRIFPDFNKVDVLKEQGKYLRLLEEINNATIIDIVGSMCSSDKCMVLTDTGLPLYFDTHHLSFVGSDFQARYILKPYLTGKYSE
jgi:peptidoglycan/LPS O-acetylase OafA/YrhL